MSSLKATTRYQRFNQLARNPARWPGYRSVSFLVSFDYVQNRSARTTRGRQPRSRTLSTCAEPSRADLESVLVATPREFESRILRYWDGSGSGRVNGRLR